jgi:hypothetical protein
VSAKEQVLRDAPKWTDAQATAALRVVAAQDELAAELDRESKLSAAELEARDDSWAEENAREAIREEPWSVAAEFFGSSSRPRVVGPSA